MAEARTRSGTLNTVGHAHRYGRPVFAVPGSIYSPLSEGTNELLRTHRAEPLCSAANVLETLGLQTKPQKTKRKSSFDASAVSADAKRLYACLTQTPQSVEELCTAAGLNVPQAAAALVELEIFGGAEKQQGERYIAK